MANNAKGLIVTLTKDSRTFTRSSPESNILSNHDLKWLRSGATVELGGPRKMAYDHRVQEVVQVLGYDPERFIIVGELERDPWHIHPPINDASGL